MTGINSFSQKMMMTPSKCMMDSDGTAVLAAASCNETLEQNDVNDNNNSSSSDSNLSSFTSSNLDRAYISTISCRAALEVPNP